MARLSARHFVGVTTAALLIVSHSAAAFTQGGFPGESQCGSTVKYWFSGGGWTTATKNNVAAGVEAWNSPDNVSGGQYVNIVEAVSEQSADILITIDATLGLGGAGLCADGELRLGSQVFQQVGAYQQFVSRHEMGHIIGLRHTGRYDDFTLGAGDPDTIATMWTTCDSNELDGAGSLLYQDDEAQLVYRWNVQNPPPLQPNTSFENNTPDQYWGKTGGTLVVEYSGSSNGSNHVRWKSTRDSDYMFLTTNWVTGGAFDQDVAEVDAKGQFKRFSSGDTGDINLQVWTRLREYADAEPPCEDEKWASGLNQNSDFSATSFVKRVKKRSGISGFASWGSITTGDYEVPSSWDGTDVQIRLKSEVLASGGARQYIRLDHVRIRAEQGAQ